MDTPPAEHILTLFDFYWFNHRILANHHRHTPPAPPASPPPEAATPSSFEIDDAESRTSETPRLDPPLLRHRRSLSADTAQSDSPQICPLPKLQTILSGKEAAADGQEEVASSADVVVRKVTRLGRRRKRRGGSKSLTDLEFEELKGFMDLGFNFSDAEEDPRLMSIVPGLQRLRASPPGSDDGGGGEPAAVARPYLSEAWEAEPDVLGRWRIPAAAEGADMKDHLRYWAHAVASAVR